MRAARKSQTKRKRIAIRSCGIWTFTFVNKWLTFFVGGLSFVAWDAWSIVATDGATGGVPLRRLLMFTGGTLVGLAIISGWHYRQAKELKAAAEAALDPNKIQTPSEFGQALLEKTFGNLTDAMGYVMVTAWTASYPLPKDQNWLNALFCFSIIVLVVILVEAWERHTEKGSMRAFLDVLGQVILSGGVFFVVYPVAAGWKDLTDTPAGDAPTILVALGGLFAGVSISMSASYATAKLCHADGKEDDTDTIDTLFGEKVLSLVKQVAFYTGGVLIKARMLEDYATRGWTPWAKVFGFCFGSVTVGLILEKLQNIRPLSNDPGPRAYWMKFRQDTITSYMKVNSWIFSGLFNLGIAEIVHPSKKIAWISLALLSQLSSLLLEEWRVRRLKKFYYEVEEDVDDVADDAEDDFELSLRSEQ